MNPDQQRRGRTFLCLLTILSIIFLPKLPAFAGGSNSPENGILIPDQYTNSLTPETTEQKTFKRPESTKKSQRITPFTSLIDVNDWQESTQVGITCKSDLPNIICLTSEQAENLGW